QSASFAGVIAHGLPTAASPVAMAGNDTGEGGTYHMEFRPPGAGPGAPAQPGSRPAILGTSCGRGACPAGRAHTRPRWESAHGACAREIREGPELRGLRPRSAW